MKLLLQWITEAWTSVTPNIVRRSFKKCGITNDLHGIEDELFQEDSDSDEDPFEGFFLDDVHDAEEFHLTMQASDLAGVELSDGDSDVTSEEEEAEDTDYESPGH